MQSLIAKTGIFRRGVAVAAMVLVWAVPVAAQSQDVSDLVRRLDRMERDLSAVQRQVYSGAPTATGGRPADPVDADFSYRQRTELRLVALEDQFRSSTGQIEQIGHSVARMQQRLDKLVADVDYRLAELERQMRAGGSGTATQPGADPMSGTGPLPSNAGGQPPTTIISGAGTTGGASPAAPADAAPATGLPQGTPLEQYAIGRRLLVQNQYDKAEQAFAAFIRSYPEHQLSENARYWLAETYYVRGDYQQAATAFLETYQKTPTGQKAPDSLLKLGMSLDGLGKQREACVALDKLRREFPTASERVSQVAAEQRRKLSCP